MSDVEFMIVFILMSIMVGIVLSTLIPTLITILLVCMITYFLSCICNVMTNTLYNNQPTNIYYTTPRSQSTQSTNQITIDGSAILNACNYMDRLTYTFGSKKQPTNKYMDAILNGNSLNSKFDNNAITTSVNTNLIIYVNMIGNIFSQAHDDIVKNNNVINGSITDNIDENMKKLRMIFMDVVEKRDPTLFSDVDGLTLTSGKNEIIIEGPKSSVGKYAKKIFMKVDVYSFKHIRNGEIFSKIKVDTNFNGEIFYRNITYKFTI